MDLLTLDDTTIDGAADLIAREHRAARTHAPTLPAAFDDPDAVAAVLAGLLADGNTGVVAIDRRGIAGVLTGRAHGEYAEMPAEGFAVDPEHPDATQVLGALYASLGSDFVRDGARRQYLDHVNRPAAVTAVADMGFGRHHYFAVRSTSAAPPARPVNPEIVVRVGGEDDLEVVAELCIVEIRFRSSAPVFSPPENPTIEDVVSSHRALRERGAVHLIARLDGVDVGVLTLEPSTELVRMCEADQPFIGETGTLASARGRGVGTTLVEAAIDWSRERGFHAVSVDFQPPNPLSRRFWLGSGFVTTGFGVMRTIHPAAVVP